MNHKLAISTVSLGWHASHTLERKLAAARGARFQGVEIFITDLDRYAAAGSIPRVQAAAEIGRLCAQHHLEVVCLGSLDNFEGDPRRSLDERLHSAREWVAMARALGTDVVQVPSNDDPDAVGDTATVVADLQALADLGLQLPPHESSSSSFSHRPVRFAYEALGWGTHVADWEESLRVVDLVARPNFGLCLDTYHVLARLWADPRSPSGRRPGGDAALRRSLDAFRERFADPAPSAPSLASFQTHPLIYVQLSDAERPVPPILPGHEAYSAHKDGVHSWCRYGRLFPLERDRGAYLPVEDVARAWLLKDDNDNSAWTARGGGWVSMEIFHRDMEREENGPEHWAQRGRRSWDELVKRLV